MSLGSDGNSCAWGRNVYSQLVDNTKMNRTPPVMAALPTGVKFTQVSAATAVPWPWTSTTASRLGNTTPTGSLASAPATPAKRHTHARGASQRPRQRADHHRHQPAGRLHLDHPHARTRPRSHQCAHPIEPHRTGLSRRHHLDNAIGIGVLLCSS